MSDWLNPTVHPTAEEYDHMADAQNQHPLYNVFDPPEVTVDNLLKRYLNKRVQIINDEQTGHVMATGVVYNVFMENDRLTIVLGGADLDVAGYPGERYALSVHHRINILPDEPSLVKEADPELERLLAEEEEIERQHRPGALKEKLIVAEAQYNRIQQQLDQVIESRNQLEDELVDAHRRYDHLRANCLALAAVQHELPGDLLEACLRGLAASGK